MFFDGQMLIAEYQHTMIEECLSNDGERRVVQGTQLDPGDFRAN
jgi:hypothetical protein